MWEFRPWMFIYIPRESSVSIWTFVGCFVHFLRFCLVLKSVFELIVCLISNHYSFRGQNKHLAFQDDNNIIRSLKYRSICPNFLGLCHTITWYCSTLEMIEHVWTIIIGIEAVERESWSITYHTRNPAILSILRHHHHNAWHEQRASNEVDKREPRDKLHRTLQSLLRLPSSTRARLAEELLCEGRREPTEKDTSMALHYVRLSRLYQLQLFAQSLGHERIPPQLDKAACDRLHRHGYPVPEESLGRRQATWRQHLPRAADPPSYMVTYSFRQLLPYWNLCLEFRAPSQLFKGIRVESLLMRYRKQLFDRMSQ